MGLWDLYLHVAKGELKYKEELAKIGQADPESVGLVHDDVAWTYSELFGRVDALAAYLQEKGVRPNDIIGIYTDRSKEMIVSVLGIIKAGAAYLPLDPEYPEDRIRFMIEDAGTNLILTQKKYEKSLESYNAEILCLDAEWDKIDSKRDNYKLPDITQDDLAYIIYTSGSTGTPKGVMVTFGNLLSYTLTAIDEFQLTSKDATLQFGTMNFDVFIEEVFPTYVSGGTLVLRDETSALGGDLFWSFIEKHQISFITLPTAFWHTLCSQLENRHVEMAKSVKLVVFGGEAMSGHMLELWQNKFGQSVRLINSYGPTETTVGVTSFDCQDFDPSKGKVPIGKPFRNMECYILDEELNQCPPGKSGELYIAGPQVAKGYLNRPELTEERFIKNPFGRDGFEVMYKSGDICTGLDDGSIVFEGRNDSQVKLLGFRIELGEIETAINRLDSVKESVVIVREDNEGDRRIVAYLVPKAQAPEPKKLRRKLKNVLADYMMPSAFVSLDKIPLTNNGKVDKRVLPKPDREHLASADAVQAPETDMEQALLEVWEKALKISPISVTDNFFEIGGHSLIAVELFDEIRDKIGAELPLAALFEAPTIRELADHIEKKKVKLFAASSSPIVKINENGHHLPFYCVHGHFGNVLNFATLSLELGENQPFYGLEGIGLSGAEIPLTKIEEIAKRYISDLKKVQPKGPYSIGGYCFGTLVALEMAKQLEQSGEEVAHLVMFDPQPDLYPNLLQEETRKRFEGLLRQQSSQTITQEIRQRSILKKAGYLVSRIHRKAIANLHIFGIRFYESLFAGKALPKILRDVEYTNLMAMKNYKVNEPWSGNIDLIMSRPVVEGYAKNVESEWKSIAKGKVRIHFVDDNGVIAGGEMFKKPYATQTAEILGNILSERADETAETLRLSGTS